MDGPALKKAAKELGNEAVKIKLERMVQKGNKDVHLYFKKRKEIAAMMTLEKGKQMKGTANGKN